MMQNYFTCALRQRQKHIHVCFLWWHLGYTTNSFWVPYQNDLFTIDIIVFNSMDRIEERIPS